MSRTRPVCQWNDAIVLSNAQQVQWRQTLLSNAITGFHSKDTKATFISWIAQSNYIHAWHVEDDATLHQSHPRTIAQKYNNSMADIIAVSWSRQVGGWVERTCNICTRDNDATVTECAKTKKKHSICVIVHLEKKIYIQYF